MEKVMTVAQLLNPKLEKTGYGQTYYEKLGVNYNSSSTEITENYKNLKEFIEYHSAFFSDAEISDIDNAYDMLMKDSILYELHINSRGLINTNEQYTARKNTEKMFANLKNNLGNKVCVEYIKQVSDKIVTDENSNDEFVGNKLIGYIIEVKDYEGIVVNSNPQSSDENTNFKIAFLGDDCALVKVTVGNNVIYQNEYLIDENKRKLYSNDTKDDFRQVCWSYYKSMQIDILDKELKMLDNGIQFIKK